MSHNLVKRLTLFISADLRFQAFVCTILLLGILVGIESKADLSSNQLTNVAQYEEMDAEERRRRIREYLGRGQQSQPSSNKAKPRQSHKSTEGQNEIRARALDELKVERKTTDSIGRAATVQVRAIDENQVTPLNQLSLGLTTSYYQPMGSAPVPSIGQNDLSSIEPTMMLGVELRILPWEFSVQNQDIQLGLRGGLSASQVSAPLNGATGSSLAETYLTSFISYLYLSHEWDFKSQWPLSWSLDFGPSRLDMIQQGQLSLVNQSDFLWMLGLQTGPTWKYKHLGIELYYQYRQGVMQSEWAKISQSSFGLGVSYEIQ